MVSNSLQLIGFDTLGEDGIDGIRYAWMHPSSERYVESAAFSQRSKLVDDNICGYTTSISSGCMLSDMNLACRFCRSGTQLPFGRRLTSSEIAKQNVFMVLADMYCSKHTKLRLNQREFAYMGQGEPGFSYAEVREAIQLTNTVMERLGQRVFRHIIATSGIPQMINDYVDDLKNGFFSSRTTIHFSLHATINRNSIMPINEMYPYTESLKALSSVSAITGEKPCIGILLLNNFLPKSESQPYTLDFDGVVQILSELNPELFRLSFCEFNSSTDLGTFDNLNPKLKDDILHYAQSRGFEAKYFSSFGKEEITACGMLGGKEAEHKPSLKWIKLDKESNELIISTLNELQL